LLQAVHVGSLAVVQELIKAGADVNMSCSLWGKTSTPLEAACAGRCYLVIKQLLQAGTNANLCDSYGKLPLLHLLESSITPESKVPGAHLLLEAKCNVNICVGDTTTLFHVCQFNYLDELFDLIVASGADLAMTTNCGMTVLHLCVCHRSAIENI